jgi:hypothetical protein
MTFRLRASRAARSASEIVAWSSCSITACDRLVRRVHEVLEHPGDPPDLIGQLRFVRFQPGEHVVFELFVGGGVEDLCDRAHTARADRAAHDRVQSLPQAVLDLLDNL